MPGASHLFRLLANGEYCGRSAGWRNFVILKQELSLRVGIGGCDGHHTEEAALCQAQANGVASA